MLRLSWKILLMQCDYKKVVSANQSLTQPYFDIAICQRSNLDRKLFRDRFTSVWFFVSIVHLQCFKTPIKHTLRKNVESYKENIVRTHYSLFNRCGFVSKKKNTYENCGTNFWKHHTPTWQPPWIQQPWPQTVAKAYLLRCVVYDFIRNI